MARYNDERRRGYFTHTLESGDVAVKETKACFDTATGTIRPGQDSVATLIEIGVFDEDKTGDGTVTVRVRLNEGVTLRWWDNDDAPNNVAASDIFSLCYIKNSTTVSTNSSGRSVSGRVWAVSSSRGVLVETITAPSITIGSSAAGTVATRVALAAIVAADRYDGQLVMVLSDNSLWRFSTSASMSEDEAQELVVAPGAGTGRWVRADKSFIAKVPIAFSNTDGEAIWTIPTGFVLRLTSQPFWEVTTGFTGGTSSAIGLSTNITGYEVAGDLLGGAAGDVAATLVAGVTPGTIGDELGDQVGFHALLFEGASEVQFDRIASAFTAGAGFACIPVAVVLPA